MSVCEGKSVKKHKKKTTIKLFLSKGEFYDPDREAFKSSVFKLHTVACIVLVMLQFVEDFGFCFHTCV